MSVVICSSHARSSSCSLISSSSEDSGIRGLLGSMYEEFEEFDGEDECDALHSNIRPTSSMRRRVVSTFVLQQPQRFAFLPLRSWNSSNDDLFRILENNKKANNYSP